MLAACTGGSGDSAAPVSTTRGHRPPQLTITSGCARFRGVTTMLRSIAPGQGGLLIDATAGAAGCLDEVTFTFQPLGDGTPPGYEVKYQDPDKEPFKDGDTAISLPGDAFLVVKITPALSDNPFVEDRPQTYLGNLTLLYGEHHHLQIVRKLADGENTVNWIIGLDGVRPFIVDAAEYPTRITVYIG